MRSAYLGHTSARADCALSIPSAHQKLSRHGRQNGGEQSTCGAYVPRCIDAAVLSLLEWRFVP